MPTISSFLFEIMQGFKSFIRGLNPNYAIQMKKASENSEVKKDMGMVVIGSNEDDLGFMDFTVEPYSYLEKLIFAYSSRIPRCKYHDCSMNPSILINILCNLFKIEPCHENIRAMIDASLDKNIARREQVAKEFWKDRTYCLRDVEISVRAYKENQFTGVHIYDHEFNCITQDVIDRIMMLIHFFNFAPTTEVINCVIKNLRNYPEKHEDLNLYCHRGVWVITK